MGEPVGFTLLLETERDRVNGQLESIKAEQREPDEEALAIDVLETRIEAGTEDSRV